MAQRVRDGFALLVVAADVAVWVALLSLGSVGFIGDPRAVASVGLISAVLLCPMSAGAAGAGWWWTAFSSSVGAATLALGLAAVVTDGYGVLAAFVVAIAAMWLVSVAHHEADRLRGRGGDRGRGSAAQADGRRMARSPGSADAAAAQILVVYASRHGFTRGIAERVAETLRRSGQTVDLLAAGAAGDISGYRAFVIGSAAYMGSWLGEATRLVRRNRRLLASHPLWLFSSGPLGTSPTDARGRDLLTTLEPKQFAEFQRLLGPRDLRVFFGGLDPNRLGVAARAFRRAPAASGLMPEGDFRDWKGIEAWAEGIAAELAITSAGPSRLPNP